MTTFWAFLPFLTLFCSAFDRTAMAMKSDSKAWEPRPDWVDGSKNNHFPHKDMHTSACSLIQKHLPSISIALLNQTSYDEQKSNYWSTFQSDVSPQCFVSPCTAQEVSQILRICKKTHTPFAVKSGGHAAFAGASSAPDGVTISLKNLNQLQVSEDRNTTRVGTGNVWFDVYSYLTPKNLSVVGGRVKDIGTGGLTLGGGISFFSGRYGWACDGVKEYEVVVASGEILQVNKDNHPDLYWALRGGGNQFGILTRLDLETFEQGAIWGGSRVLLWEQKDKLLEALYGFAHQGAEGDVDAAMWLAFAYAPKPRDMFIASPFFTHAKGVEDPAVFKDFLELPHVSSTLRVSNMTDLAEELAKTNPDGLRESYWTHNFLMTREMLGEVTEIWKEEVEHIKDVAGVLPALVLQPVTRNIIKYFSRNGGNALGMDASQGPLLLMSVPTMWTDTSKDELVINTLRRMIERCVERSKEVGAWHPYIYMNYAAREQRVYEGYGEGNLRWLREISRRWDPEGVFGRLQGGYFRLWD